MYIFNRSGSESGSESGFGPEFNSSYESYSAINNTYDNYDNYDNESKVSVKLIHILILIFICLVCVIIPFFYDDIIDFFFNIKSKCRTINCYSCKKCSIKPKIEPIFDDSLSKDTDMCTICLIVNNQKSITLCCEHRFHEACIRHWVDVSLKKYNNVPCPLCRTNIFF